MSYQEKWHERKVVILSGAKNLLAERRIYLKAVTDVRDSSFRPDSRDFIQNDNHHMFNKRSERRGDPLHDVKNSSFRLRRGFGMTAKKTMVARLSRVDTSVSEFRDHEEWLVMM